MTQEQETTERASSHAPSAEADELSTAGAAAAVVVGAGEPRGNPALFHLAFQRVEAEIRAVPVERLVPINFDVRAIVATILGAYPRISALRPQLARLDSVELAAIDGLKDYALALGHTHTRFMLAAEDADDLSRLTSEGVVLRDQLLADARALAKRGLLKAALIEKLHNGNGYKNIAFDLVGLAELFLDAWVNLAGRVAIGPEELEQARLVGNRMIALLGRRKRSVSERDKVATLRQQAYVLCSDAYQEARHAIAFVRRRAGDVDSIAPSLFAGRGGRRSVRLTPAATAEAPAQTSANASVPIAFPGLSPFVRS